MRYAALLCAFLACCMAHGLEFENMKFFPVDHPECRGFVVIEDMDTSYRFYSVSRDNTLEVILAIPKEMNICSVDHVEQSPDGDKVVILSEGEGHPALAIYRISDILVDARNIRGLAEYTSGELYEYSTLSCLGRLDPYPGLCDSPKWVGNDTIEFIATGVDFREFDPDIRRGKMLETTEYIVDTWRWKFTDDTFTLLKSEKESASPKRTGSRIEQIKKRIRPDLHEKRK